MELVGGDSDLGIPSRELTYPTCKKRNIIFKYAVPHHGGYVNFLEGNRYNLHVLTTRTMKGFFTRLVSTI